jgi:hypothetical protein
VRDPRSVRPDRAGYGWGCSRVSGDRGPARQPAGHGAVPDETFTDRPSLGHSMRRAPAGGYRVCRWLRD